MASPFPGMDPYLEQPAFWASFHRRLIGGINAGDGDVEVSGEAVVGVTIDDEARDFGLEEGLEAIAFFAITGSSSSISSDRNRQASPKPTMPGTLSVPGRKPYC